MGIKQFSRECRRYCISYYTTISPEAFIQALELTSIKDLSIMERIENFDWVPRSSAYRAKGMWVRRASVSLLSM